MKATNATQTLTQVGPGTPMGALMRQFWIPALLSSELQADGAPVRLKLLGEQLIAFRTASGRVGIMDHRCLHRGASLFYGRNEEEGLRCVYHGWKFDPDGRCLEIANVSPARLQAQKLQATAYRTLEAAGVVWVYMGARATPPPMPDLPVFHVLPDRLSVWCMQRECNYLQALEGDLDTSHAGILHLGAGKGAANVAPRTQAEVLSYTALDPEYKVASTEWGVMAGAYRPADASHTYWRFTNFLLPFFAQVPPCPLGSEAILRAWVPMDDTHTMFFSITSDTFCLSRSPRATPRPVQQPGLSTNYEFLPNTSDWYGRWRPAANPRNDHLMDRQTQRTQSYTGIEGLDIQDAAVTESMGAVKDHDLEHLVASDVLVVRTRRRLLEAMNALKNEGKLPACLDGPELYRDLWSGYVIAPSDTDWRDVYAASLPEEVEFFA